MLRNLASWLSIRRRIVLQIIMGELVAHLHRNVHREKAVYMSVFYRPETVAKKHRFQYHTHIEVPWDQFSGLQFLTSRPVGMPFAAAASPAKVCAEIQEERQRMEERRSSESCGVVMLILEVMWGHQTFLVAVLYSIPRGRTWRTDRLYLRRLVVELSFALASRRILGHRF